MMITDQTFGLLPMLSEAKFHDSLQNMNSKMEINSIAFSVSLIFTLNFRSDETKVPLMTGLLMQRPPIGWIGNLYLFSITARRRQGTIQPIIGTH